MTTGKTRDVTAKAPSAKANGNRASAVSRADPHDYPRRILLAVTGLSSQVLTETLYALVVQPSRPWQPTEIHLVTTTEGAERARLTLLSEEPGWFHRFCRDYGMRGIAFDESHIHILRNGEGEPLPDIRSESDNEQVADALTSLVGEFTADPDCTLHVSIAGGRKTRGYYAGYALPLFGRPQDRLSHVLVAAPFESNPEFYYPTPYSRVIYTPPPESRPIDARDALVSLAQIPFVRLRDELPTRLLEGRARFSETIAAAQRAMEPPSVLIDLARRQLRLGGETPHLPPADLAFYAWMARRAQAGMPPVHWTDPGLAEAWLTEYRAVVGEWSADYERATETLAHGMTKEYFEQRKSRTNSALQNLLGAGARPYLIAAEGKRTPHRFGLRLGSEAIHFHTERWPQRATDPARWAKTG